MIRRQAALAVLTVVCLAGTQPAVSEESGWQPEPERTSAGSFGTVTCESQNNRGKHCAVENIDTNSVSLQRRLSQTVCQRGSNWGVDRDGIWVDNGCRAVFAYRQVGGGWQPDRPDGQGSIRCESNFGRRNHCGVPNIDPGSVTKNRELSNTECRRGQNWGVDSGGIWVDGGCRAEFGYTTRFGGSSGNVASESRMQRACIDRAAREWAAKTVDVQITRAERLQNGGYRFNLQSRRVSGTCMVDRSGNVYRLDRY